MHLPIEPLQLLLLPLCCLLAGVFLIGHDLWFHRPGAASVKGNTSRRPCRYCRFGGAHLVEERVYCEGEDRVETRCYVCHSCSLPQWTIVRVPLKQRVQ